MNHKIFIESYLAEYIIFHICVERAYTYIRAVKAVMFVIYKLSVTYYTNALFMDK